MFRRAPQGLKPFLNTLRDGTTEVVPSRTHRSPKLRIFVGDTEGFRRWTCFLRASVAKSRDSVWFTIVKRLAASVARRNGRENFLVPPLNEQPGKQN